MRVTLLCVGADAQQQMVVGKGGLVISCSACLGGCGFQRSGGDAFQHFGFTV
jgi:hypothetical protein